MSKFDFSLYNDEILFNLLSKMQPSSKNQVFIVDYSLG